MHPVHLVVEDLQFGVAAPLARVLVDAVIDAHLFDLDAEHLLQLSRFGEPSQTSVFG